LDPAILQIHVTEGGGAVYSIGSRATRGVTVQVTDETGKPVEGASVSFRLPENGPAGTFASGLRTEVINTGPDGCAQVWGMQWNRTAGPFEMRITAASGETRAGAIVPLYLTEALLAADPQGDLKPGGGGGGNKKLWISLAIAGAAVVALAAASGGSNTGAAAASTVSGPRIGLPTIVIGRP
jgi:hypothetical protein